MPRETDRARLIDIIKVRSFTKGAEIKLASGGVQISTST